MLFYLQLFDHFLQFSPKSFARLRFFEVVTLFILQYSFDEVGLRFGVAVCWLDVFKDIFCR